MTVDEQADDQAKEPDASPADSAEIVPVVPGAPAVPKQMSSEKADELKARTAELVERLTEATGSAELQLMDEISNVGVQAQRSAGAGLDLLRGRVGDLLTQEGTGGQITGDLVDLRTTLERINPAAVTKPSFWERMIRFIPFIGRMNPALRALQRIAIQYEPVTKQVQLIETKLREGRGLLARDNVELRQLYEQVENQQLVVLDNAYMGELLMQQLTDLAAETTDPMKTDRVQNALHDVAMRVQDLRTMEEVHNQYFVSIEMTRQNNNRLGQSVERTLSMSSNVVVVGLAIQTALSRQRKVLEATQRTREFLGSVIVANAAAIKQQTEEIGEIYNNPVIAIDKITQAHSELMEAIETASRLKEEGIATARENIAKLAEMSSDMQNRIAGLAPAADDKRPALEA